MEIILEFILAFTQSVLIGKYLLDKSEKLLSNPCPGAANNPCHGCLLLTTCNTEGGTLHLHSQGGWRTLQIKSVEKVHCVSQESSAHWKLKADGLWVVSTKCSKWREWMSQTLSALLYVSCTSVWTPACQPGPWMKVACLLYAAQLFTLMDEPASIFNMFLYVPLDFD